MALLHLRLQGKEVEAKSFIAEMSGSDWCKHLHKDVRDLYKLTFKELLHRCRMSWLSIAYSQPKQVLAKLVRCAAVLGVTWLQPTGPGGGSRNEEALG